MKSGTEDAIGPRALLANPSYLRLWLAGGLANAMRFLEMLVASIFTYELTGSALAVAAVTVAHRSGLGTGVLGTNKKPLQPFRLKRLGRTAGVV